VNLQIAVAAVSLAGEQALQLALAGFRPQARQDLFGIAHHGLVALGLRELDQAQGVVELALDRAIAADAVLEPAALLQQPLRLGGLFPELGIFDERLSSARRRTDVSQSKMPPQQSQRPSDVVGCRLVFSAHAHASEGNGVMAIGLSNRPPVPPAGNRARGRRCARRRGRRLRHDRRGGRGPARRTG